MSLICERAASVEEKPCHWIWGWDQGFSYCYDCAEKKIEELKSENPNIDCFIDGGFSTETDCIEVCEGCGCRPAHTLTDFGAEQVLSDFEETGFDIDSADDCYHLQQAMDATICNIDPPTEQMKKIIRGGLK